MEVSDTTEPPEEVTLYPSNYANTYGLIDIDDATWETVWTQPNKDDDLEGWEGATKYIRKDKYDELNHMIEIMISSQEWQNDYRINVPSNRCIF